MDEEKEILEFLDEIAKLKENARMLTEGYIFSQDNIQSNVNKWVNKEEQILYIMGGSGSGKTTLANHLSKQYNCRVVHLDKIHHKLVQTRPELIHNNPNKHQNIINYAYKELGDDYGIIEGDQLRAIFDQIQDKPIIIMGTSPLTASYRMAKRTINQFDDFKQWGKDNDASILGVFGKMTSVIGKNARKNFKRESDYQQMRDTLLQKQSLNEDYKMQFIFYHGSQEKYPELLPVSPNMGNRWESPKWVTYMWKEKENAIRWGMQRAITTKRRELEVLGKEGNIITWGEGPYIKLGALSSEKDIIKKIGIGVPFYVYTIQIKPNTLGVGHATGLDEYTSTDPKPKILKLEKIKITEKLIDDYIEFLTPTEWDKYTKVSLSATRGDLAGLMYDQEETFKRELFIKIKQRAGLIKPGDNLQVCVDQYLEDKEKYTKLFSKFKSLRQLVSYINTNVKGVRSRKEDNRFFWPDEVLTKKIGSCWDIALLIWHYSTFTSTYTNKIPARICRLGFSFRPKKNSSLYHQYHCVCMIQEDDKWKVINFSANHLHPDLKDPIYTCRYNKQEEVLKSFAHRYIPVLYQAIQQEEYPDAIMEERIIQVASNRDVQDFWVINNGKACTGQKQKMISELFEKT